jgi:phosphonate transport system substrate-binding protein
MQNIAAELSKLSGLTVAAGEVESTAYLIQSLGEGTVHIAMLAPFAYLSAHEKGNADAALAGVVNGKQKVGAQFLVNAQLAGVNGYKVYFDETSNVNVVDAVTALAQFYGKRPCWASDTSAAGYVLPLAVLRQQGISVKTGAVLQGDASVVKTIYEDRKGALCDFGVTLIDSRVDSGLEDVGKSVLVVWRTDEIIPLDGLAYSTALPDDLRFRLTAALLVVAQQNPDQVRAAFGVDNLQLADDTFYNDLRGILQISGLDLNELVR